MNRPGDSHTPGPQQELAPRRPFGALRSLWALIDHAGPRPVRALRIALILTGIASIGDIASLALLQRAISAMSGAGAADKTDGALLAGFLGAALIATVLRLLALRQRIVAEQQVARGLTVRAFQALQMQDYSTYLRNGASAGFAAFERLSLIINQALAPFIAAIVSAISVVALTGAIAWLYPLAGAVLTIAIAAVAVEAAWRGGGRAARMVSSLSQTRSVLIYEARHAFRDIFLTNGQERLCADFAETETAFRNQLTGSATAAQSARHTIEIAGLAIALVLLLVANMAPGGGGALLPLLAVLALAALRLLPQIATGHTSVRMVALHGSVADDVLALLEAPLARHVPAGARPLVLTDAIRLEGVVVSRPDRPDTLTGLNLTIPRGARIGIRGASGAGKSTLLDVICGAIQPDAGTVRIDSTLLDAVQGKSWRERIGVVSQTPILLGRTLREAVVFPERIAEADPERFAAAIARAGIDDMVKGFEQGLDTPIGEAVSFLSGGQRQRLALAHALYRAHDLLILDEATGQLDSPSEEVIVAALRDLPQDLTLIVVSHREAPFACCEVLYELSGGKLVLAA
jgi:ABC-type multidrug transport system fused ATPase/permease subunit